MMERLYYRKWEVEQPKACLYIVHGLGEHSGRYTHVAEWLNQRGVAVYSGDLPGFGQSPGKRGHVDSFEELIRAVEHGWKRMASEYPNLPHFLLGHSLGGLIVTYFLLTRHQEVRVHAAVISSPAYRPAVRVPVWKEWIAAFLTPIFPTLALSSGIAAGLACRDPDIVTRSIEDPYCHSKVSLQFYHEFKQAMSYVFEHADQFPLEIPVLWMQAGEDQLVDPKAVKEFYQKLPADDIRKYKEWPGLYHEILNEPEREEVLEEMWNFLERHIRQ